MKSILGMLLAVAAVTAHAGATGGFSTNDSTGIVTPDIAIGMRWFQRYVNAEDGNMVVCPSHDLWKRGGDCERWTPIRQVVPKGRTYVGFRIVSGEYGRRELEVYWK